MKTLTKGILAALAGMATVGCDPYAEVDKGQPVVISAMVSTAGTAFEGTQTAGAWSISGVPSDCTPGAPAVNDMSGVVFVKFSKLLDGFSVQTDVSDCQPARTPDWLTVTPAAPAGFGWYACYNPSSPTPTEGASVAIFRAPSPATISGWEQAGPMPASATVVTDYRFQGSVNDKEGHSVAIDVTAHVDPNPGTPGDPTFTYTATPTVEVSWTAADCGGAATYIVERAPNVPTGSPPVNAPGTFAVIAPAVAGLTYSDAAVTAGTSYWYRVTGRTAIPPGVVGAASGETMATVP